MLGVPERKRKKSITFLMDNLHVVLGHPCFVKFANQLMQFLSYSCGASPFVPIDLPYTASFPHLALFSALLKSKVFRDAFFNHPKCNQYYFNLFNI